MYRSLALCVLLASASAYGDDQAKAKVLYDEGLRHYNVAEYKEAIAAWKEAYFLSKKPLLLFNLAQAYRLGGDCTTALTFYDSYTRESSEIKNQDEVDQGVAACKAKTPVVAAPPPAAVVTAAPPPPAPVPERHASGSTLRGLGIGVTITGVLVGATGIYFGYRSGQISKQLDGWAMPWTPTQTSKQNEGQRDATLGWVLGGGGVALAVAGSVMFALGGHSSPVAIAPVRGGAAIAYGFGF